MTKGTQNCPQVANPEVGNPEGILMKMVMKMIRMMSSGRVVSHGMTQGRGMMMHRPKACSDIPCSRDEDEDFMDLTLMTMRRVPFFSSHVSSFHFISPFS